MGTELVQAPPSADFTGGGSEWVDLVRARNDIDAHLVAGVLVEAGIETRKVKDRSGPGAWLYGGSDPWAPVDVLVRRYQRDDAALVLAEVAWDGPAAVSTRGGDAGGGRPVSLRWWAAAFAAGVVLTGVALARTPASMWRCELPLICGDKSAAGK